MKRYINFINRRLTRDGYMVVPYTFGSPKMLREHANVSETHHPSRGGSTVHWMREVADMAEAAERKSK